ncbi:vitamin B6 photo-protection and homoeostasis-domain-containing protein [Xylariomycetidae sp. FL2044]|nr:vitamin B6 photo-protection and homoeostasis-domain-containing protein [Xylariomycetidae sp. FL2044]
MPPKLIRAVDESGVLCVYDTDTNTDADADDGKKKKKPKVKTRNTLRNLLDVFLPAGYPHTVTPDYTPYQVYDSLQAFFSTIAGLLASRAVLEGFGVGSSSSSSTSDSDSSGSGSGSPSSSSGTRTATLAVLLTVLQESTGRLATILFAHRAGRALEPESKRYRFLADILNDAALALDLASPVLAAASSSSSSASGGGAGSDAPRVLALCASGVLRALCGVAGGAAKASLSAHFASASSSSSSSSSSPYSDSHKGKGDGDGDDGGGGGRGGGEKGSLAELSAKDGSQETVVSLLGMLCGSLFVGRVSGRAAVWSWMAVLLALHLWTNYRAVRAVQLRTLNRQRATLLLDAYGRHATGVCRVLRPDEVAAAEGILFWPARLRPARPAIAFASTYPRPGEIRPDDLVRFERRAWVIVTTTTKEKKKKKKKDDRTGHQQESKKTIYLKQGATALDALQAWGEALLGPEAPTVDNDKEFWSAVASTGWDLRTNAMETGPAVRIVVE